jgi:4-hydroxybenzoyl-CoA thioesterase
VDGGVRIGVLPVHVEFGHCDPAGIVWYPNFYEWFDAASHRLAERAGVGLHALRAQGYVGLPLMQTGASYHRPVRFGDDVEVHSTVTGFERRSFRVEHRILRGAELMLEGFELRFLGQPHPEDPQRLRAAEIPEDFRQRFGFA